MQALLITAYKDFDYLDYFIGTLNDEKIYIYIHIDRKNHDIKNLLKKYNTIDRVTAISRRKINWGGINHLYAILDLLHIVVNSELRFNYLHIISGQDFVSRKLEDLHAFFNSNNKENYMTCCEVDEKLSQRYKRYYFMDTFNYKQSFTYIIARCIDYAQRLLHLERKLFVKQRLYKGLVYVSITNDFAEYVDQFIHSKEGLRFLNFLKFTFIPEEFFFQTIIKNSNFRDTLNINNYRYLLWEKKYGSCPGILDEKDYKNIIASNVFFSRKLDLNHSYNLIKEIQKYKGK